MKLFDTLSVRHKLIALMVTVSFVSLLIASIAFIKTDRVNTQQVVSDNLGIMASIIAANSTAALMFGDAAAARETLSFLESRTHIQAAAIYNATGIRIKELPVSPEKILMELKARSKKAEES